jgi:ureidoacrylate peracid hydrolase
VHIVDNSRFGAFVPDSSKLNDILQARGLDTLIIIGTATNVPANRLHATRCR